MAMLGVRPSLSRAKTAGLLFALASSPFPAPTAKVGAKKREGTQVILSRKYGLLGCVAVVALGFAAGARAEQAVRGAAAPPPATGQAATVEEVVVTATRRSEALQNVPGQVTALTGDSLQKLHANS